MTKDYTTTRIWTETIQKLRMIYALTGESMVSILDRLVSAELERLQKDQTHDDHKSLQKVES
jgi:hypothetical protein